MPWKPSQRAAIAARMAREGKSREEIREFFHKHGHGGGKALVEIHRRRRKRTR